MDKKKIPTGVGIAVIIIIATAIGVLVWKFENNTSSQTNQQSYVQDSEPDNSEKKGTVEISANWTLVSHYNFWNNPEKFKTPNKNRFPDINFFYPENWEFRCCGDMGHASENFINPPNRDKSSPYIRITTFVLRGCQNSRENCSLDEQISITAKEKFNRLKSSVLSNKVLQEKKLDKLNTSAFVYKKSEKDGKFSMAYLINLEDDVIQIDFVNYELLDEKFIENFLNRIEFETK